MSTIPLDFVILILIGYGVKGVTERDQSASDALLLAASANSPQRRDQLKLSEFQLDQHQSVILMA
jgi:hypothetical protein